jgi:hypothetical protein
MEGRVKTSEVNRATLVVVVFGWARKVCGDVGEAVTFHIEWNC